VQHCVGSKGGSCAWLAAGKKVRITGEKAVELITARCGGQRARGRLWTTDDATGSGGIVEVGGCRSAPLSKQRGERESERGRRRSAREEEEMEGGDSADGRTRARRRRVARHGHEQGRWPLRQGRGGADEWARGYCVGFKPGKPSQTPFKRN
jgi:hypothetical protein